MFAYNILKWLKALGSHFKSWEPLKQIFHILVAVALVYPQEEVSVGEEGTIFGRKL